MYGTPPGTQPASFHPDRANPPQKGPGLPPPQRMEEWPARWEQNRALARARCCLPGAGSHGSHAGHAYMGCALPSAARVHDTTARLLLLSASAERIWVSALTGERKGGDRRGSFCWVSPQMAAMLAGSLWVTLQMAATLARSLWVSPQMAAAWGHSPNGGRGQSGQGRKSSSSSWSPT